MHCMSLRGASIAADKIGEPSGGADIYFASLVRGPEAAGEILVMSCLDGARLAMILAGV
jgi:hypothetical protein